MTIPSASGETLRQRVRFERLVTELSAGFINVPTAAFDRTILRALRHIVEGLGVDRSTLTQYFPESGEFIFTHCWVVDGLPPTPKALADRQTFAELATQSLLSVPLAVGGTVVGALSLGAVNTQQRWPNALIPRVWLLGEVFANAVNTLDLEAIILGGGVSNIPLWYDHVPAIMTPCIFGIPNRRVPIIRATLGDSAGVLGAAFLALREMKLMEF